MLIKNLPFEAVPSLELNDTVYRALSLMQDNHVNHLPVAEDGVFAGICSEEVLLGMEEDSYLKEIQYTFLRVSVKEDDHFLKAVQLAANHHISIIPVTDGDNKLLGCIESNHLLNHIADFLHLKEPSGMIVLEIESLQYSFSEISKIVETNDAQITQLNTTKNDETGIMQVTICINKLEISDIVATFQRYDYKVKYYFGDELYTNELKDNYENLMNYLNI